MLHCLLLYGFLYLILRSHISKRESPYSFLVKAKTMFKYTYTNSNQMEVRGNVKRAVVWQTSAPSNSRVYVPPRHQPPVQGEVTRNIPRSTVGVPEPAQNKVRVYDDPCPTHRYFPFSAGYGPTLYPEPVSFARFYKACSQYQRADAPSPAPVPSWASSGSISAPAPALAPFQTAASNLTPSSAFGKTISPKRPRDPKAPKTISATTPKFQRFPNLHSIIHINPKQHGRILKRRAQRERLGLVSNKVRTQYSRESRHKWAKSRVRDNKGRYVN